VAIDYDILYIPSCTWNICGLENIQCTAEIDDQERLLTHKDGVARIKIAQLLQRVIAWNFAAAQPSSAFFTSAI